MTTPDVATCLACGDPCHCGDIKPYGTGPHVCISCSPGVGMSKDCGPHCGEDLPGVTLHCREDCCHGRSTNEASGAMSEHNIGSAAASAELEFLTESLEDVLIAYDESGDIFGTSGAGSYFLAEHIVASDWFKRVTG